VDISVLYMLGAVAIVLGLTMFISWMRRSKYIVTEDLLFIAKVLDLSLSIIDELDLQKESEIKQIGKIVYDAIEFGIANYTNPDEVKNNAYNYAIELCNVLNIKITDKRKEIIKELLVIGLQNKYLNK
jgi:hypothetical protein